MSTIKRRFENDDRLLDTMQRYTHTLLKKNGLSETNSYNSAKLICSIAALMREKHTAFIGLAIQRHSGNIVVRIVSEGNAYNPLQDLDIPSLLEQDPPMQDTDFDAPLPKEQLLKALRNSLSYYRRNQHNEVEYIVRREQPQTLKMVTIAFLLAIASGALLRYFCGDGPQAVLTTYLLTPIQTMFLNCLKMLVVPVVFFTIASSVANVTDIRAYGRIGTKILIFYMFTSFLAVGVGYGVYQVLQPGNSVVLDFSAYHYSADGTADISLIDTLVNIIPSSFVGAFTNMEMLQIIFLALLTGAATNLLEHGGDRQRIGDALGLLNRLFLKIASIAMKAIPLATYCTMTLLVLTMDGSMLSALLKLVLGMLLGVVGMFIVYGLLLLIFVRKNPLRFYKKCIPNFISFITFCSTSAVMPQSLETCKRQLGISPKISSFSMPLGSTINMDGACVYLTLSILFLAAVYHVPLTIDILLKLGVTIVILSMGAPPIAGAGLICLSILVQQVGIPIEALGILMGIDQIMSMCRTLINGTGDFVGTAIVAKSENLINANIFDRK